MNGGLDRLLELAGTPDDALLGRQALERGWITADQLRDCEAEQALRDEPFLASVMLRRKCVEPAQVLELLRSKRDAAGRPACAEGLFLLIVLLAEGRLSAGDARRALREQRESAAAGETWRLAEILARRGLISVEELRRRLFCSRCGRAFADERWTPKDEIRCEACVKEGPGPAGVPFGRYRLVEKLGWGGEGVVWKAWDERLNRFVALKETAGEIPPAAPRLAHPGILPVHDAGVFEGRAYFTTDWIDGEDLQTRLARGLPPNEALRLIREAAGILHFVHQQGLVHGDLKPSNFLVGRDGALRLIDFGTGRGTPRYMSPEQAESGEATAASDQFSLGVILYELLTGRHPFEEASLPRQLNAICNSTPAPPRSIVRDLPREVEAICMRAIEKKPERRYPSLEALARDVDSFLGGGRVSAHRGTKRRWALAAAALLAAVGAGFALRPAGTEEIERRLAEGGRRESAGALEEALVEYQAVLSLAADHGEAKAAVERVRSAIHRRRAREEEEREAGRRRQEALRMLEDARAPLDEAWAYVYNANANYRELLDRVSTTQELIEGALRKAPDLALGYFLLGRAWELKGWPDKAVECWRKASAIEPQFGPPRFHLGRLLLAESTHSFLGPVRVNRKRQAEPLLREAEREIRAAARLGGIDGELQARLATTLLAYCTEEPAVVIRKAREGIEAHAGSPGVEEFHLVEAIVSSGRDAERSLDRAISLRPKFPLALFQRGVLRARRGDVAGAIRDLSEAIDFQPRFASAFFNRAISRISAGDLAGAVEDCARTLEVVPQRREIFHFAEALKRELGGDSQGAVRELTQSIEASPEFLVAVSHRAALRAKQGDWAGAVEDFGRCLEADPGCPVTLTNRGLARMKAGDVAGALRDLDRAIEQESAYARAYLYRATARQWRGDMEGARDDLERAIRHQPEMAEAHRLLATWHLTMGDPDRAEEHLKKTTQLSSGDVHHAALPPLRQAVERARKDCPAWLRALGPAREALRKGDAPLVRRLLEGPLAEARNTSDMFRQASLAWAYYTLGCAYAALARDGPESARWKDLAFEALNDSVEAGFSYRGRLAEDSALSCLRDDSRWAGLLGRLPNEP